MIRTSLVLPPTLHQRLVWLAREQGTSVAEAVREILDSALQTKEKAKLSRMYQQLDQLTGIAKEPISDASATIDELLYGKNGAWRGQPN